MHVNSNRAERGEMIVTHYHGYTGSVDAIMTDLAAYCDREGLNFAGLAVIAKSAVEAQK